jgi:hypothetical protein
MRDPRVGTLSLTTRDDPRIGQADYSLRFCTHYACRSRYSGEKPAKRQSHDARFPRRHLVMPGGPPMLLMAIGTVPRRGFALILHDSTQPPTTRVTDWKPAGLCGPTRAQGT